MAVLLFANNTSSIIASPINAAAVTVTLADASAFPVPAANQYFIATFVDAATQLLREIVHVTAVSGNDLTIVRAQEGTTARSWNVGDVCGMFWTAGAAQAMLQQAQNQAQTSNYAIDTGTTNAWVITLDPAPTSLSAIVGTPIRVNVSHVTNSTSITLNINGLGAQPVRLVDGTSPGVGFFINGTIWTVIWNGVFFAVSNVLTPASNVQVLAGTNDVNPITPLGLLAAFPHTTPFGGGAGVSAYQKFPSGLIVQWGNYTSVTGNDTVTLPTAMPNRMMASVATAAVGGISWNAITMNISPGSAPPVSTMSYQTYEQNGSAFLISKAGVNSSWIAIGW